MRRGSYLLVGHLEELERGLLQVGGCLLDVLSCFRVLVGQHVPDLGDLLLQLGALRAGGGNMMSGQRQAVGLSATGPNSVPR